MDAAGQARTLGDLPALVGDLVPQQPRPAAPVVSEQRAVERFEKQRREALWTLLSTSTMLATGLNALRVQLQRTDIVRADLRRQERKQRQQLEKRQRRELEANREPDRPEADPDS
jgi:hypothetical protein